MISNYLDIVQIVLLLGVITFLVKRPARKKPVNTPHVPEETPRKYLSTPSGNIVVREKIKPKSHTDEKIAEREG